jgi:H/ACA ribonucleoprotein complex subunit 3
MSQIFKCSNCNSYTLDSERCPKCGSKVSSPKPARFSMDDKYGKYRREAKRKSRS